MWLPWLRSKSATLAHARNPSASETTHCALRNHCQYTFLQKARKLGLQGVFPLLRFIYLHSLVNWAKCLTNSASQDTTIKVFILALRNDAVFEQGNCGFLSLSVSYLIRLLVARLDKAGWYCDWWIGKKKLERSGGVLNEVSSWHFAWKT